MILLADDWSLVRLRKALIERIDEFLDTPEGKRTGFNNPSQYIDHAVRELLKDYFKKRFEHINLYDDKVRVLDNTLGKQGDIVTIQFKNKTAYCDYCNSGSCVHVKYVWELPEVAKLLKKHNLRPPI